MKNNQTATIDDVQLLLEQEILGSLITTDNRRDVLASLHDLQPSDFRHGAHRIIFESVVSVFAKTNGADMVSVTVELQNNTFLEKVGGAFYIGELQRVALLGYSIQFKIAELKERARKHALYQHLRNTIDEIEVNALDTSYEIVERMQEQFYSIVSGRKNTVVNIGKTFDGIITRAKSLKRDELFGSSWGIAGLDFITSGIERGKTYVIGGTKKSGKSKFIINTMYALRKQEVKTLFLSLEMNGESVVGELISRFAGVENNTLKQTLTPEMEKRLLAIRNDIAEGIYIDAAAYLTTAQVKARIRQYAQQGVQVVFLDYLQRMDFEFNSKHGLNFATAITHTVSQLADICKEQNVALVFLSQLNVKAEGEQADISHLKDSGGIAEGVDCIIILNNQDRIKKNYTNKTNEIWLSIEQRSGASGFMKCTVDLSQAKYEEKG